MPLITEPFKPHWHVDKVTKHIELSYLPKITIFVKVGGQLYPFKIGAFVDSGAIRNLFPADILDLLNIQLESGKKKFHYGIGGVELLSYIHKAEILVSGRTLQTEIDFNRDHKPPLLGIKQFFEFFDSVNFDMERSQLELRYSTNKN
jgi:hypothetical protein